MVKKIWPNLETKELFFFKEYFLTQNYKVFHITKSFKPWSNGFSKNQELVNNSCLKCLMTLFLNENPGGSVLGLIPFHFATHRSACDESPQSWLVSLFICNLGQEPKASVVTPNMLVTKSKVKSKSTHAQQIIKGTRGCKFAWRNERICIRMVVGVYSFWN